MALPGVRTHAAASLAHDAFKASEATPPPGRASAKADVPRLRRGECAGRPANATPPVYRRVHRVPAVQHRLGGGAVARGSGEGDERLTGIAHGTHGRHGKMMPQRIQLSRKKGWRKPANTVVVARPSRWGNPFRIVCDPDPAVQMMDAMHGIATTPEAAVNNFRTWLRTNSDGQRVRLEAKQELRGKNLACWCKLGTPCHADVLLEVANA